MKRGNVDILMLGVLLVVFAVMTFLIAGNIPDAPETTPRRTTYSAKPGGLKAAFLLLQRYGFPTGRIYREPRSWPGDASVIITTTPFFSMGMQGLWSEAQAKAALAWVERGGTLIIAQEEQSDLLTALGLQVSVHFKADATLEPRQPVVFLRGVARALFPDKYRFDKTSGSAVTLFGDQKPALVALPHGAGTVYALSTPAVFDNRDLATADNARLLVRLVDAGRRGRGRVYFDEFHLGYGVEESLWTMIGKPGQFVVYQLILLALLTVYTLGRRFGLPRPLPAAPRLSSEYVASLADLYRRAGASDAALEGVYLVFWRDLCRATGVPFDTVIGEVARRASGLAGPDADREQVEKRIFRLLGECEDKIAAGPKQINEATLLRLAQEMEDVRKELQLGGDD